VTAPATVRDAIFARIEAALLPLVEDGGVELEPSGDPDIFPSLSVFDGGHRFIEREAGLTRRVLDFTVEGYVEAGDGSEAMAARNLLQAQAVAAIMAGDTFGGIIEMVEDGDLRMATATLASRRRLMFAQDFAIEFVTARGDPAKPA
jgi:hypothetical protein